MHTSSLRLAMLLVGGACLWAPLAQAQTIETPNGHPDYRVELEPHATVAVFRNGLIGFEGRGRGSYFGTPGFVRLNFGTRRALLEEALERLGRAVRGEA